MTQLKKLKISQLSKAELNNRELNRLIGGEKCCICTCYDESSVAIHYLSTQTGYQSPYGGTGGGAFGSPA